MGFEERFGGFERGGVGGLMARERGKGKGDWLGKREVLAWRFVMGSGLGFSEVVGDKQR